MTDFDGADELRSLLAEILPAGWIEAAVADDEPTLLSIKRSVDSRAIVRTLGAAGWVAPHYPKPHGGRGLPREQAQQALTMLDGWEVPRTPRGSGLPLAAPTIMEWSSDESKARLLPPLVTGEERWCQSRRSAKRATRSWAAARSTTC